MCRTLLSQIIRRFEEAHLQRLLLFTTITLRVAGLHHPAFTYPERCMIVTAQFTQLTEQTLGLLIILGVTERPRNVGAGSSIPKQPMQELAIPASAASSLTCRCPPTLLISSVTRVSDSFLATSVTML